MDDPLTSGVTEGFGLMFYNARWYDPYITHFTQADTIIPGGVQGLDRYAAMNNNPVRYNDPSGHHVTCDKNEDCKQSQLLSNFDGIKFWKVLIKNEFGVTLSDGGATHPRYKHNVVRAWDQKNVQLVYYGLSKMNKILGGFLKRTIGSATFTLNEHPDNGYFGYTTYLNGSNVVDFYASTTIPLQNLYHEFGHVFDNSTGGAYSQALGSSVNKSDDGVYWFGGDGAGSLDPSLLLKNSSVDDPNFGPLSIDAIQALPATRGDPGEQFADIWANYMAGNIDLNKEGGSHLYLWLSMSGGLY